MQTKMDELLAEIEELNALDNKTLPERIIKFNEEFGEFNAEVGKLIGITHKPYDKPHLIEEAADFLQNAFSVLVATGELAGFTLDDIYNEIKVKNQKWRSKAPLYTKNLVPEPEPIPTVPQEELVKIYISGNSEFEPDDNVYFIGEDGKTYVFDFFKYNKQLKEYPMTMIMDSVGDLNEMIKYGLCYLKAEKNGNL
jgi:NTP pyrophosphatase (non-canonical NTP hydrolase)